MIKKWSDRTKGGFEVVGILSGDGYHRATIRVSPIQTYSFTTDHSGRSDIDESYDLVKATPVKETEV